MKYTFKTFRTKYLKITQKEYAKLLELSRSSVAKKESGEVSITIKDLKKLREKCGIDLNIIEI